MAHIVQLRARTPFLHLTFLFGPGALGFRFQGLGFRVWGRGFGVAGDWELFG